VRVAILTGGGDCPGLNAVIRAVQRTLQHEGRDVETVGVRDGFLGLIECDLRPLGPGSVSGILPLGGTILGTSNRDDPFRWIGESPPADVSDRVLSNLARESIDAIVVIGGDGTLDIAHRLALRGVNVVGVPKTIDNDLAATDRTFGFDTAVGIATEALDRIHTTAASHHRVMLVEVMGRHAGWIALHSGMASGGDVILIPEIPFRFDSIVRAIQARKRRGKRSSIVVAAEGACAEGGSICVDKTVLGGADTVRLGGIARVVGDTIEDRVGLEVRATILGHVQRGGTPTASDRILATRFGVCAARQVLAGNFGSMVSLRGADVIPVPLLDAVGGRRLVDPDGPLVSVARATGIRFGDE
jgi:6-phosphofructokinase 1